MFTAWWLFLCQNKQTVRIPDVDAPKSNRVLSLCRARITSGAHRQLLCNKPWSRNVD